MPVGPLKRIKRETSSTTLVELSIALAVALLLVMTGLRLLGGFGTDIHRASAQPSAASPEITPVPTGFARSPKSLD